MKTLLNFYGLTKHISDLDESVEIYLTEKFWKKEQDKFLRSITECILCKPSNLYHEFSSLDLGVEVPYCSKKWVTGGYSWRYR